MTDGVTESLEGDGPLERNLDRFGLCHGTGDAALLCRMVMARWQAVARVMQKTGMMTARS